MLCLPLKPLKSGPHVLLPGTKLTGRDRLRQALITRQCLKIWAERRAQKVPREPLSTSLHLTAWQSLAGCGCVPVSSHRDSRDFWKRRETQAQGDAPSRKELKTVREVTERPRRKKLKVARRLKREREEAGRRQGAQQLESLAAWLGDLRSIPGTAKVEEESETAEQKADSESCPLTFIHQLPK